MHGENLFLTVSCNATIFFVLATIFIYLYSTYKLSYWARRGIYSPPCHWLFGHFRDVILLKSSAPKILGELHNSVESNLPYVGVYILHKPLLLLRNSEIIKQILIKDFSLFSNRYFANKRERDPVGSKNLFSIDNPEWKYLRSKLSPAFTSGKQRKLFAVMLESASNMRNHLKNRIPDNEVVNLEVRQVASKYTTDVMSSLSFGIKTNCFENPEPEFYTRSRSLYDLRKVSSALGLFCNFFFPKFNDLLNRKFLGPSTDYFRKVFWESMNNREKPASSTGDAIDFLLAVKNDKKSEFNFDGDDLLAQSAIFHFAGPETTAVSMIFALWELAKHPEIQSKVRLEIHEKLGSKELTYESVSEMTYLRQIVYETFRLYPPAPFLDRVANEDYKVPGTDVIIEKGTIVYATLTGIHMDPENHPDPTKFDPERFSEERKKDIKAYSYMPFGIGPRMCIGNRLGEMITMVGLITILKEYEISINGHCKNELSKRAIFLAPSPNGIHLLFQSLIKR